MAKCIVFCAGGFNGLLAPPEPQDFVIAADGGLLHARGINITPDLILGDFDSLGYVPDGAECYPAEKDDTDAMLAARRGLERDFTHFVFYGALEGARLDHTVANLQTLQFLADRGARGFLVGKDQIVTVLQNGALEFPPGADGTISVFCMGDSAAGVDITGLHYPLHNGTLTSGFPLGVSNKFTGQKARIHVARGSLLVIYDRKNGIVW